jgi:hypothetical protein
MRCERAFTRPPRRSAVPLSLCLCATVTVLALPDHETRAYVRSHRPPSRPVAWRATAQSSQDGAGACMGDWGPIDRPSAPGKGMDDDAKCQNRRFLCCQQKLLPSPAGVFIDVCSVTSLLPSSDLIVLCPPSTALFSGTGPIVSAIYRDYCTTTDFQADNLFIYSY